MSSRSKPFANILTVSKLQEFDDMDDDVDGLKNFEYGPLFEIRGSVSRYGAGRTHIPALFELMSAAVLHREKYGVETIIVIDEHKASNEWGCPS